MADEWRQMHWGDLATLEYGKRLRGYEDGTGRYRVFGTNGPIGWHDEPLCHHPTVVVGRKGAYRGVHHSPGPCFVIDTAFYLKPRTEFNIRWAYYALLTHDINTMDSGSAIPSTSRDEFYRLPVQVPPKPEQRAIANILGALDDKIELNRRMNETLEAIAQAVFKSWFVDFDPVRSKMAGRQPYGMDAATAALFPDSFVHSGLGDIPKGWRAGLFTEEIAVVGGGTPKTAVPEYWDGDIPWFSVVDAPDSGSIWVWDTEKHISRPGLEKSSTKMLAKGTTIISARGTVGKCALVGRSMAMNQSCYGIQAASERGAYYTHFAVRHEIANLQQNSHGSVFDTITTSTFAGIERVVPPANVTQFYDRTVSPSLERALASLLESSSLAAIRDALLPRLISGEIRVGDAERFLKEGRL